MASAFDPDRPAIAFDDPMKLSPCETTVSMFARPPNCCSFWSACRIETASSLMVMLAAWRSSGVVARIEASTAPRIASLAASASWPLRTASAVEAWYWLAWLRVLIAYWPVAITSSVASRPAIPRAATLRPTVHWMWRRAFRWPSPRCSGPCGSVVVMSSIRVPPCSVVVSRRDVQCFVQVKVQQECIVELEGALDRPGRLGVERLGRRFEARVVHRDDVAEAVDHERQRSAV